MLSSEPAEGSGKMKLTRNQFLFSSSKEWKSCLQLVVMRKPCDCTQTRLCTLLRGRVRLVTFFSLEVKNTPIKSQKHPSLLDHHFQMYYHNPSWASKWPSTTDVLLLMRSILCLHSTPQSRHFGKIRKPIDFEFHEMTLTDLWFSSRHGSTQSSKLEEFLFAVSSQNIS
jgi:hypothetical protein